MEVYALPPLQTVVTLQDRHLTSLFGPDDDNKDKVPNATQTPMFDGTNNEQVFTPFTVRIYCSIFPYLYGLSSDVDLAKINAAHVLAKVREADTSFNPDKFDLRFHPRVTKTLTTVVPSVLLSQYGFTDPTKMELSLF